MCLLRSNGNSTVMTTLFVGALTVPAVAAPPRVIKAIPDNGDTGVDPSLREIRVTFDQDMQPGGYSWCGGGKSFPEVIGRPGWDSKCTAVLRVRLKPNHQYHLSINCPAARNFISVNGESAKIYPLSFRTGGAGEKHEPKFKAGDHEDAFDLLREAIAKHYAYRDLRGVDWDAQFRRHERDLKTADSPADFARKAARLLAPARDIHMWLEVDGQTIPTFRRSVPPNADFETLEKRVPNFKRHNAVVSTGRFEDGIGYILIATWSSRDRDAFEPAFVALGEFADAPGLIIDVRFNAGGDESLAGQFAGCFVDKWHVYAKHVFVSPNSESGFTPPMTRTLKPNKARPQWRGKVAVLTGRQVMSSCEAFLLMMEQVPDCKLVGETSYGASGNPKPFALPNGVTVYLPSWKSQRPDGTGFEGKGIKPDIEVKAKPGAFQDGDPVLEVALKFLRE